jgi:hypothetical protein
MWRIPYCNSVLFDLQSCKADKCTYSKDYPPAEASQIAYAHIYERLQIYIYYVSWKGKQNETKSKNRKKNQHKTGIFKNLGTS